jgi:glutamyl-tRNA synthetase
MHDIDNEELWQMMGAEVHEIVPNSKKKLFIDTIKPVIESTDEALFWAQRLLTDQLTHGDEERVVICEAGHDFYQAACDAIDDHDGDFEYFMRHITGKTGASGKALEMPIRIALTGMLHGPELKKVFKLVGSDQAKLRFEQVMDLCHCH